MWVGYDPASDAIDKACFIEMQVLTVVSISTCLYRQYCHSSLYGIKSYGEESRSVYIHTHCLSVLLPQAVALYSVKMRGRLMIWRYIKCWLIVFNRWQSDFQVANLLLATVKFEPCSCTNLVSGICPRATLQQYKFILNLCNTQIFKTKNSEISC